jgi:two-component sensor histidine kinase
MIEKSEVTQTLRAEVCPKGRREIPSSAAFLPNSTTQVLMAFSNNRDRTTDGDTAANTHAKGDVRSLLPIAEKDCRVRLMAYLDSLADALSHSLLAGSQRLSLSVSPLGSILPYDEAVSIGLMLNELVSHAVKHAIGTISISFELAGPDWRLAISDDRRSTIDRDAPMADMNSPIVQALARVLDAQVTCSCTIPQGFTVSVTRSPGRQRVQQPER